MKTFKVTYFDECMEIATIKTYHNVVSDDDVIKFILSAVHFYGYLAVKVERYDSITDSYENITSAIYHLTHNLTK